MTNFQVGEKVLAVVGTKAGEGIIVALDMDFALVEFPDCEYPLTMVQPTSAYCVPLTRLRRLQP